MAGAIPRLGSVEAGTTLGDASAEARSRGASTELNLSRFSYAGEQSKGFYDDSKKNTQALYFALTHRPSSDTEWFFNNEVFFADYTENFGVNRVTQRLIDTGLYQTGINNNPAPNFAIAPVTGYVDSTGTPMAAVMAATSPERRGVAIVNAASSWRVTLPRSGAVRRRPHLRLDAHIGAERTCADARHHRGWPPDRHRTR